MAKVYIPLKVEDWDEAQETKRTLQRILGVSTETLCSSEIMVTIIGTQDSIADTIDRVHNLVDLSPGLSMPLTFYRVFDGEDDEYETRPQG